MSLNQNALKYPCWKILPHGISCSKILVKATKQSIALTSDKKKDIKGTSRTDRMVKKPK